MAESKSIVIADNIEIQIMIYSVRGKQVMLDSVFAELYHVESVSDYPISYFSIHKGIV